MKRCPSCNRSYTDASLNFCLEDGTPLVADPPPSDSNATKRYPPGRDTSEPPPTEIYRPDTELISQTPTSQPQRQPQPQQWTPMPVAAPPRKKSNAVWWVLGGVAALGIIGIGLVVMIIALASMSAANSNNANLNRNENRNANLVSNSNTNTSRPNTNSSLTPGSLIDDFSESKWGTGESKFGHIWYDGGEYHMSSKDKTFIVMYAPSDDYNTEDATVKVKARIVDGTAPSSGFGLMVHCAQSKAKQLEDYALLIYPSDSPEYEIIMHKDGTQTSLVNKTPSTAIHSGTSPNLLEVRIKGSELSFYANGEFLTKINDTGNYKRGRVGFYTSDVTEVAFDDLQITR
ncbi:MAG TPA: hypothetical protein VJ372_25555 [Pyrinomonadaceae bacterium]|jgi:hypothetical protein|nr:hypothetical protein [Pyrinomonadaceae bacterium]